MAGPNGPSGPRKGYGGAWVTWLVVLVIIGVGIWLIFAWTAGPAVVRGPVAPSYPGARPVTSFAELDRIGANWQGWLGRPVQLAEAPVLAAYPGKGMFVGTNQRPYFVRATTMPPVTPGENVSIIGAIGHLPANPIKEWNLPPAEAGMFNKQTVYIQATSIQAVAPGPGTQTAPPPAGTPAP